MADLTPDQAIEKLKALPEDKQRAVLMKLSPEERKGILGKIKGGNTPTPATPAAAPTPGPLRRLASSFASGAGVMTNEQGKNFFRHPIDTAKGMLEAQGELGAQAGRELKSGDVVRGVTHGVEFLLPGIGPSLAHAGEQLESGDIAGGVGTTLGVGTTIVATPERVAGGIKSGLSKVGQLRETAQATARKVVQIDTGIKERLGNVAEKHGEAVQAHKVKHAEVIKDNLQTQREARTAIDREKMAIGEKNKGIEAENKAQAGEVAKRGELAKTVDEQSHQVKGHIEKVEASVAKEANAKFEAVRAKIGNPETPAQPLVDTVKNVEANVLQNIPENIKEFRAILKMEPLPEHIADAVRQHAGFEPEGSEPLTWDKLQSLKSRLDARLRSRSAMNGDLKRALYQTRDAVVDEMGKMADANGAQGEWAAARDFWRQYKEDFHEPTGPSGSASPVAQSLLAVDAKNIRQPFLRTQEATRNRGVDILRKYPEHGGTEAAQAVENLMGQHKEMSGLPAKEPPKALKPVPEVHQLPENKPIPKRPEPPTIDLQKEARDIIAHRAKNWGSFNARDIGIIASGGLGELLSGLFGSSGWDRVLGAATGVAMYEGGKFYASRLLNKPAVIEWLSKTPPEEAAVLAKIPGADKIKIVNALTDTAVKSGKPVALSPAARQLLGAANVARIMAAGAGGTQIKNRRDAIERLGRAPQ